MAAEGEPDAELATLEALADEIQAEDEHAGDGQAHAGSGGGGGDAHAAGGHWVHECWESAVDLNSGTRYWFNRATGVSQWHPPTTESAADASQQQQQQHHGPQHGPQQQDEAAMDAVGGEAAAAPAPAPRDDYAPGLYYRDAYNQLQGPFNPTQLREWRGMLAMDLPILRLAAGGADGGKPEAGASGAAAGASGGGQDDALPVVPGMRWWRLELAELLGDDELLARWRLENPEQADWPGTAPPAAAYEAERQRGTAHSLAEAVLFGLPAHDEAVAVARAAAVSGRTIQEVLDWRRSQDVDYTATGHRVAARGRIQAPGAPEPLYAEIASWTNPHELEEQLAKAAARRKRALSGEELRRVKERKQQLKEKKRTGWLYE